MKGLTGYLLWLAVNGAMALMLYTGNFHHLGIVQAFFVIILTASMIAYTVLWCLVLTAKDNKETLKAAKTVSKNNILIFVSVCMAIVTAFLMEKCGFSLMLAWYVLNAAYGWSLAIYCKKLVSKK